ncbi:MAG TPA: EAL domain-containing protein [Acidimicrobiales bacterium]|nr:EAL domain-containing protein [Acidimicrobiales bacterium]
MRSAAARPGPHTSMRQSPVTDLGHLRLLSRIAEQVGEGVAVVDNDARILYANAEFAAMHGCTLEQIDAQELRGSDFYDDGEWAGPVKALMDAALAQGVGRAEVTRRRADGTTFDAHVTLSLLRDESGELVGRVLCVQDITERRAAEASLRQAHDRLEHLASTDRLTGLVNRAVFDDRLERALALGDRQGGEVALLFVDVDRFKTINDGFGHHSGDQVLVEVARRLVSCVRRSDTVARLGGDEFAVLLGGSTNPEHAASAAERIVTSLRPAFVVDGVELFVSASIGVALWPEDCRSKAELLQHADAAMYRAKAAGGSRFEMFQPAMTVAARERLKMEADLRRAVDADELFLRWSPQVELRTGRTVGLEALIRWRHPERGEVAPAEFLPLAEETALIVPIGRWVLEEACRRAAAWRAALDPSLAVAVNVSSRQLLERDFVPTVTRVLAANGLPAGALELEITEGVLLEDEEPAIAALGHLRELGVRLVMDDFGTGYSSLSSLRRPLVDAVKLDMSLIAALGGDRPGSDGALVAAAVNLAHALGLQTVAEGIADDGQIRALAGFGCERGQGYHWARPLLSEDVPAWLAGR